MADPFAVFGDDPESNSRRDSMNGVLVFHEGTERALLHFVENEVANSSASDKTTAIEQSDRVLALVDQFCMARHWMMHVGDIKGLIVEDFLTKSLISARPGPFVIVEIGTYCGYSLIRIARTVLKTRAFSDLHIITVDINPQTIPVAKAMAQLAGVADCVTFVQLHEDSSPTELSTRIRQAMMDRHPEQPPMTNFLFIDHAKELYLRDLLKLESSGLVRATTHVCADNVLFFKIDEYRGHMQQLEKLGVVKTRMEVSFLEYSDELTRRDEAPEADLSDGLELTVYLSDPPNPM